MLPINYLPSFNRPGLDLVTGLCQVTDSTNSNAQSRTGLWHGKKGMMGQSRLLPFSPAVTVEHKHGVSTVQSGSNQPTLSSPSVSFPLLAIGGIPPPPPDVLLAALSYGRAANMGNTTNAPMINNNNNNNGNKYPVYPTAINSCHSAICPSMSSPAPMMAPDARTSWMEIWFRMLTQRSSALPEIPMVNPTKETIQAYSMLANAKARGCVGGFTSNIQNPSNVSSHPTRSAHKLESRGETLMACGPSSDPHISVHRDMERTNVKVICRQLIPDGHIFGPISSADFVHSHRLPIACRIPTNSDPSLSWMTMVRGTQNQLNGGDLSQANLVPIFCTAEQLVFLHRHGLLPPSSQVSRNDGLVYFRATRCIFPGEELILQDRYPMEDQSTFWARSGTCQSPDRLPTAAVEIQSPSDQKPIDPVNPPSSNALTRLGTPSSKFLQRLLTIVSQNGTDRELILRNLIKHGQPGCISPSVGSVPLTEEWSNPKMLVEAITQRTGTTELDSSTHASHDHQSQRPELDDFNIQQPLKPSTGSSGANMGLATTTTTTNQLRTTRVTEMEENGEGYSCEYCGKMFAYQYYRDKHLKYTRCVDQGNRKYPCKLCSRSFEKRDRLRIHVLHVHEKRRPHKCHLCEKSFSQSSSLNKHLRVHSGERPYKCCYCNKAFTASSILRTHIRQHSGEKPFKCKFCWKPFASHAAHDSHVRRTHADSAKPLLSKKNVPTNRGSNEPSKFVWRDQTWTRRGHLEDGPPPTEVDASTSSNESIAFTLR